MKNLMAHEKILSDCIPIKGKKRIPYLIIASVMSLVPWLILGSNTTSRSSTWHLVILLTVQNLGSAMADVVVDAMIAEAVRDEKASFAGDLQSVSWLAMAFGGVFGSLLGGYALTNLEIAIIFLLFSILPAIQLFSCGLVEENPINSEVLSELSEFRNSHVLNGKANHLDEDSSLERKSSVNARRRKKNQKKSKRRQVMPSKAQNSRKGRSLLGQWFQPLKTATYSLCRAFKQPIILR
ncbi:Biopterin transport-related protein BT1 [Corchorus olitorius]|uniref:Biopterin transport-related protein BT1 n=1 Tax=Corchorus olitorius TaxID=93759 RepID=A0A1R3IKL0_9ROSI|nr:Biopterin transport-related protein BT1 [Corchorus olitorius]